MHKKNIQHIVARLHSGLAEFYYHKMLFAFAFNMIMIFVLIYLLTLGFPLTLVILWVLLQRIIQPFFTFAGIKLTNLIGMKNSFILTLFLTPVYLFMFWQISAHPWLFVPAALLMAFTMSVYWSQENTLFMELSKSRAVGWERGPWTP
jgi:hypothetical protein